MDKCKECGFEAKTSHSLKAHIRMKHNQPTTDPIAEDMIRDQRNRDRLAKKRKTADSFNKTKVYGKDT